MSAQPSTVATVATLALNLSVKETLTDGVGNSFNASISTAQDSVQTYANGVGSGNIRRFHEERVVLTPASGTYDLDLTQILDPFGNVWNTTIIRAIYVKNRSAAGGGQLLIGGASSNPWTAPFTGSAAPTTAKSPVNPGGKWYQEDPYVGLAVSGSSKVLRFTHNGGSSGSITFDLVVIGY